MITITSSVTKKYISLEIGLLFSKHDDFVVYHRRFQQCCLFLMQRINSVGMQKLVSLKTYNLANDFCAIKCRVSGYLIT